MQERVDHAHKADGHTRAEDHGQEFHPAAQRPDKEHQHRPANKHLLRARAGDERVFQEVAERKLACRRRGRVAGAVHIVDEHEQHKDRRDCDDHDRHEPTELHRRFELLGKIGVEALDAPLFAARPHMREHCVARAGLLIGVNEQIRQDKKPDGDELHDLHTAVKVHFDHVGELRERRGRKQRAQLC